MYEIEQLMGYGFVAFVLILLALLPGICWRTLRRLPSQASNTVPNTTPELQTGNVDIDAMVNRFLGWKLPPDFVPDGGIAFHKDYGPPHDRRPRIYGSPVWPVGTNLFTADQARAMLQYVVGDQSQLRHWLENCTDLTPYLREYHSGVTLDFEAIDAELNKEQ